MFLLQGCEFIIALTHMRVPNDIKLLESDVEIDLILGGHDHHYETKQVSWTGLFLMYTLLPLFLHLLRNNGP